MTDVNSFLAHYGVKGMKWGVIREQAAAGNAKAQKKLDKADAKWERKMTSSFPFAAYNHAADHMNRVGIPQINNSAKYKGKDLSDEKSPTAQAYYKDYSKMMTDALNNGVKATGSESPSGKKKLSMQFDMDNGVQWRVEES